MMKRMHRSSWNLNYLSILFIVSCLFLVFVFYQFSSYSTTSLSQTFDTCKADEQSPVLIAIETKLGVNFNAGHWFHMAELIMTRHSQLLNENSLLNHSKIYVSFDQGNHQQEFFAIRSLPLEIIVQL
jgi:hypothetical protein